MKIEKLNRFDHVTVEQYAIRDADDKIVGGFTMVTRGNWALMGGLHVEDVGHSLLWLFRQLRDFYPTTEVFEAYRATGGTRGPVRFRWRGDKLIRDRE